MFSRLKSNPRKLRRGMMVPLPAQQNPQRA
jgi:hypothetical protein